VSYEMTTAVVGNLTADPELRHTSSGIAFATFTVASTARILDGPAAGGATARRSFCAARRGEGRRTASPAALRRVIGLS
jgi:single-stranded DNA-binding protein